MGMTEGDESAEAVVDGFVEGLFRLMLEHYQAHVLEMGLTPVQAQALNLLRAAPLPTSKLAAGLGISAPAVTQLIDRLGRKHLIERRAVESDRRAVIVAVTEKGERVIDGFRSRRNDVFVAILSKLSAEDRAEAIDALCKVAAVLHGDGSGGPGAFGPPPEGSTDRAIRRTPPQPPEASKKTGKAPVSLPAKRMRIEWD